MCSSDLAAAFGCTAIPVSVTDVSEEFMTKRLGNAVETTLPRFKNETYPGAHSYVTDTRHSMFLTSIIVSKEFWHSLSDEDKKYMKEAALYSSKLERKWTLEDSERIANDKNEQLSIGIKSLKELPQEEVKKLKEAAKVVYEKYEQVFTKGLVNNILKS